ncbi:MAG: GGDEF domain-containing protein [Lachnospiraceae bacterium]|nr:GGDEF domain-containing protein [Butyrivibrio sp.]MCM1344763.1 GGDEF domain-containing protein [Muribaculaceae bacterium]MCM1411711.1 GGDEF domain-containing protein [Lachnospiraceae bacterium]
MGDTKNIALIINASNFERQKVIVKAAHRTLQERGGYTLYVFSNYGAFYDDTWHEHGEGAIYDLLNHMRFDGCIMEGNLGSRQFADRIAEKIRRQGTPLVTINIQAGDAPFLTIDAYKAGYELMEHLTEKHGCTRINLVQQDSGDVISTQMEKAYREVLAKKGIPYDERRVMARQVSVQNGRSLYEEFQKMGIGDAEAVICVHDVMAIGLCLELEDRGFRVPGDMLLCTLNYSTNSIVFRPMLTGADRMDEEAAKSACDLLEDMMAGKMVNRENFYECKMHYGTSCGCDSHEETVYGKRYQELILAKVEAATQVSGMMQYNNALEKVDSLDQLADNLKNMLEGISCSDFFCCLNQSDLKYIVNEESERKTEQGRIYDRTMVAVTGVSKRTGQLKNVAFPVEKLFPAETREGDILIFLPVHYKEQDFGYMVFLNEYFPIEIYNYRICHESIGSSIENLRRQMILQSSIQTLDELHMKDQMTGLYNRFGLQRFRDDYTAGNEFTVAIMDMDGLKRVNDEFGHLAGNHALCIIAKVLQEAKDEDELLVRYGGDEFLMLSRNTQLEHWQGLRERIDRILADKVNRRQIRYQLGVSIGYAISTKEHPLPVEQCCELADQAMYQDKSSRKRLRAEGM